jgi:SNF2 family DNA or RNA helicase
LAIVDHLSKPITRELEIRTSQMDDAHNKGMYLYLSILTFKNDIKIIDSSKSMDLSSLVSIISYDLIAREEVCQQIENEDFHMVIVDESHFIKSASAKRTKSVTPIIESATRAVLLSGTATPSRPIELYTQIKSLTKINLSEKSYGDRYCEVTSLQLMVCRIPMIQLTSTATTTVC